ncbi:MAG: polymorphic toxin type 44 domain-containing protein [Eubacteriales bacterium]|nr:polymorphic toxin type 44 domain-containing protein [Eubacteriales bacterium]
MWEKIFFSLTALCDCFVFWTKNNRNIFGYKVSSSDLGNLNYALVGKALGIPETLLLQQAGAAQLRDHDKQGFFESQYNSLRDRNYGDEEQDQDMIMIGFDVYNSLY